MWIDNDEILKLLDSAKLLSRKYPCRCPVCRKKTAHIFLQRFEESTIGGGWVWCSSCKNYSHCSYYVPDWWENIPTVDEERLESEPDYLEEKKDEIDAHVLQVVLKNRPQKQ